MYILAGRSCSGKNAVAEELIKRGHKRCITYTSRPMRQGEVDGVDYHFISDSDFIRLKNEGFFAEYISYDTTHGIWWYGTAASDFKDDDNKKFIILTPEGIKQVEKIVEKKPKIIYLFANNATVYKRLKDRGDNPEEAERRMKQDAIDFKGFEMIADKIVYNNTDSNIIDVVDKVEKYVRIMQNR